MTIKTPDINAISGVITDELLTEYDEIQAVTQKEASISSISNIYQLLNKGISGKELDYVNLAHTLLEDEAGLNNVPMGVSNQSLEVLEAESADLSLSRKDDTNLAQGNKWHPVPIWARRAWKGRVMINTVAVTTLLISQIRH